MTSLEQPPERFRETARVKLADEGTLAALDTATGRFLHERTAAWEELEDVEELREQAREVRTRTIDELDRHLDDFERAVVARGGHVHRCRTAEEARAKVAEICRAAGAQAGGQVEVDGQRGDRAERGARGGGDEGGGDRPGGVHPPARRRAPRAHHRARNREDRRRRGRALLARGGEAGRPRAR